MRFTYKYNYNSKFLLEKLLNISKKFTYSSVLFSNSYKNDQYSSYKAIAAFGAIKIISSDADSFNTLRDFHSENRDWLFGFLSYDLKNETEKLKSNNPHSKGNRQTVQLPQVALFFRF